MKKALVSGLVALSMSCAHTQAHKKNNVKTPATVNEKQKSRLNELAKIKLACEELMKNAREAEEICASQNNERACWLYRDTIDFYEDECLVWLNE